MGQVFDNLKKNGCFTIITIWIIVIALMVVAKVLFFN